MGHGVGRGAIAMFVGVCCFWRIFEVYPQHKVRSRKQHQYIHNGGEKEREERGRCRGEKREGEREGCGVRRDENGVRGGGVGQM